jgi:hypothetical protein
MRLRAAIVLSVVSAGLGAGLVACFDLFHSTSGILDACELDAEACSDAAPPADLCTWEGGTPQTAAAIACTWMGTCEGTFQFGDFGFGECTLRALLAFDCQANPNNPVSGPTKQAWFDLLQAKSCADVDRIVFPGGVSACPDLPDGGAPIGCDGVTRIYCTEAGARPFGENCAMWNQTCFNVACVGCLGCFAGADAGACAPDASATCNGDIATSCPNGALETIDCHELLQQSGTCNPGPLTQEQDPTSPCYLDAGVPDSNNAADAGDAGRGCVETCTNDSVTTCARGVANTFDCTSIDASCPPDGASPSCVFPH